MRKRVLLLGSLMALLVAGSARAASVDVTVELNPGQSGPIYGWSLRITTQNQAVGGLLLLLTGFDSVEFNAGYPPISLPDSLLAFDVDEFGRDLLIINTYPPGNALVQPFTDVFLGTLRGPSNSVATVKVENCEVECGGTVGDINLLPVQDYALHLIPEPGMLSLGTALLAALVLRRRAC